LAQLAQLAQLAVELAGAKATTSFTGLSG